MALFRVLDPLLRPATAAKRQEKATESARLRELEREKGLVLKAIREIEHDHQMRKISDADHKELTQRYRGRALRLINQIDAGDDFKTLIEQELKTRLSALEAARSACAGCGVANEADARFCKKCGKTLAADGARGERAMKRHETRRPDWRRRGCLAPLDRPAGAPGRRAGPGQVPDLRSMSGRPLMVADLPAGTVSLRVVRQSPANPVAGVEVTSTTRTASGEARSGSAKTGPDGRATFENLPAGADFQATVTVDGERLDTIRFPLPRTGGTRIMLIAGLGQAGAGPRVTAPARKVAPSRARSAWARRPARSRRCPTSRRGRWSSTCATPEASRWRASGCSSPR